MGARFCPALFRSGTGERGGAGMLEELGISFGTAVVVLVALYFVVK